MKTTQLTLALFASALATVLPPAASAQSVAAGPPIKASDLATHLNVFTYSLTYRQERPFKWLRYALTFKERLPDGTYVEKAQILAGSYPQQLPITEISVAVFLDKNHASLFAGASAMHGRGYDFDPFYTTGSPPPLRPGGGYILMRTKIDLKVTDTEANTKGILELELKASE